jgi:hypothetical protein
MGIAMHGPLTDCEDKVGVIGKADLNLPMKHSMPKNDAFKDKLFTISPNKYGSVKSHASSEKCQVWLLVVVIGMGVLLRTRGIREEQVNS